MFGGAEPRRGRGREGHEGRRREAKGDGERRREVEGEGCREIDVRRGRKRKGRREGRGEKGVWCEEELCEK